MLGVPVGGVGYYFREEIGEAVFLACQREVCRIFELRGEDRSVPPG